MSESTPRPECPRCGYDLTGAVVAWREDSCPLDGTCSECGLAFPWCWLLGDMSGRVPWLIESQVPGRWKYLRTLLRSLRARRFWRSIPLALPIRPGKLVLYVATTLLLVHVLFIVGVVWSCAFDLRNNAATKAWWSSVVPSNDLFIAQLAAEDRRIWSEMEWGVLWPYRDRAIWIQSVGVPLGALGGIQLGMVLTDAGMALVYLVLIRTFARARLRRGHLMRGIAYGVPYAIASGVLIWLLPVLAAEAGLGGRGAVGRVTAIFFVAAALFPLPWFWHGFTKVYLRLPHAAAVAIVALIVSVLSVVLLALVFGALASALA